MEVRYKVIKCFIIWVMVNRILYMKLQIDGNECKPVMYIVQGLNLLCYLEEHITRNRSRCDHNPFRFAFKSVG